LREFLRNTFPSSGGWRPVITFLILMAASILGGATNALAGGGTFMTFPALLLAGVAPVEANATASLVLLPGAFASAWVYRDVIRDNSRRFLLLMSAASVVGSTAGSLLLLNTSNATFSSLVPWLLLAATAVFTLAPWLRNLRAGRERHQSLVALTIGQVIISGYGGYFGAGMGVLMIALYLVATNLDVQSGTALRMVCSCAINTLAVAIFAWRGAIDYSVGIPMLVAGIVGGYLGALAVKRLNAELARRAILIYAWALTAWFFGRLVLGK
jgi:uncharacterized membrane protein YfcA